MALAHDARRATRDIADLAEQGDRPPAVVQRLRAVTDQGVVPADRVVGVRLSRVVLGAQQQVPAAARVCQRLRVTALQLEGQAEPAVRAGHTDLVAERAVAVKRVVGVRLAVLVAAQAGVHIGQCPVRPCLPKPVRQPVRGRQGGLLADRPVRPVPTTLPKTPATREVAGVLVETEVDREGNEVQEHPGTPR
jgi:hypothetical protein